MKIAIAGPASPSGLTGFLDADSARRAVHLNGLGGNPIVELVQGLITRGHEVTLITLARGAESVEDLRGPNLRIAVGPYRPCHRARDAFKVERNFVAAALASAEVDVVHAHWTYEFALGALATGLPTLVTAHDAPLRVLSIHRDPYRLVRAGMAALVARRARWMTAVSPNVASHFRGSLGAQCPIAVIPNGLSDEVFEQSCPTCKLSDPFTIATVLNGFERLKNGHVLDLDREHPTICFTVFLTPKT